MMAFNGEGSMRATTGFPTSKFGSPQPVHLSSVATGAQRLRCDSIHRQNIQLLTSPMPSPAYHGTSGPQPEEDHAIVCIKLLAHLKRRAAQGHQRLDVSLELVRKSLAALRQIGKRKTASIDYSCVILMSSVMIEIVQLCERTCNQEGEEVLAVEACSFNNLHGQSCLEPQLDHFNIALARRERGQNIKRALRDVLVGACELSTEIAFLLKRNPHSGFHSVGRHESLHLELEQRLRTSLDTL